MPGAWGKTGRWTVPPALVAGDKRGPWSCGQVIAGGGPQLRPDDKSPLGRPGGRGRAGRAPLPHPVRPVSQLQTPHSSLLGCKRLRTGLLGAMSPSSSRSAQSALFCLGLCLRQVIQAQDEPLPAPTLQALPGPLVPLDKPVTLRCQGPPGVGLYRLEKLRSGKYEDQATLYIPAMKQSSAGRYRCSYQNGSRWSPPSEQLKLVATGVYDKPTLSAQPGPAVSPGGDVTLQCRSRYGFDQYALYKKADAGHHRGPERWYQADFPIITVTAAHRGTYRCYSFSSRSPYLWSAPSDPLELVVTGTSGTPSQPPTGAPSSATPPARDTTTSSGGPGSTTEPSRDTTVFSRGPDSTTGLAHQDYTKGNLVRICLGAAILLFLVGILVEDWHSRKRFPLRWVRAVHRPLPPVPQAPKPQSGQDGGRPAGHPQGLPPSEPQDVVASKRS